MHQLKLFGTMDLAGRQALSDNTIFRIYSMTKPVIATVVRFENGKDVGLEPVKRDVTVHDLLTHTAGFIYCGLKGIPQNQYAIIPTRHHH